MKICLNVLLIILLGAPGLMVGSQNNLMFGNNNNNNNNIKRQFFEEIDKLYGEYCKLYIKLNRSDNNILNIKQNINVLTQKIMKEFQNYCSPFTFPKDAHSVENLNYLRCTLLFLQFTTIYAEKIVYENNVSNPSELKPFYIKLFDQWVGLRLECAECLDKNRFFLKKRKSTDPLPLSLTIINFSPLAVSRWNPFGWGNWYDRLHRTIVTQPTWPWNEEDHDSRMLVKNHLSEITRMIDRKANAEDKSVLKIYFMIMQELRLLIKDNQSNLGRNLLRSFGLGAVGLGALGLRYFLSKNKVPETNVVDKKSPKNGVQKYLETKK